MQRATHVRVETHMVSRLYINPGHAESYPCQHSKCVITLRDGRERIVKLNGAEIDLLITYLSSGYLASLASKWLGWEKPCEILNDDGHCRGMYQASARKVPTIESADALLSTLFSLESVS